MRLKRVLAGIALACFATAVNANAASECSFDTAAFRKVEGVPEPQADNYKMWSELRMRSLVDAAQQVQCNVIRRISDGGSIYYSADISPPPAGKAKPQGPDITERFLALARQRWIAASGGSPAGAGAAASAVAHQIKGSCPGEVLSKSFFRNGPSPFDDDFYAVAFGDARQDFQYESASRNAYLQCLSRALSESRAGDYLFSGTGKFRPRIVSEPAIQMQRALAALYPSRAEEQDPLLAARLVSEAYGSYLGAFQAYEGWLARKQAEYDESAAAEERRYRESKKTGLLASALGFLILDQYAKAPSSVTRETIDNVWSGVANDRSRELSRLSESAADLQRRYLSFELPTKWDTDGVRLNLARFGSPGGAYARQDHTRYLVRVLTAESFCTGALVHKDVVLTAQHCLYNADGSQKPYPYRVALEYLRWNPDSGVVPEKTEVSVDKWWTPPGRWSADWRNDYAFLKLKEPLLENWVPLRKLTAEDAIEYSRISIAGYSSDLNSGAFITMDWGCGVKSASKGILNHSCRAWKGASGAPIILSQGLHKGEIIGLHVFGDTNDANHGTGGGPYVTDQMLQMYQAAIQGR